jgi:hypothetical protein
VEAFTQQVFPPTPRGIAVDAFLSFDINAYVAFLRISFHRSAT